ncbi:MAG: lipopolysaccharide heptosyltransferase I [Betaproteobacteria bacterium]
MKILIVKLSSLGDVIHAMPAVQDILAVTPQAQIDWVVERSFAPLVRRCAGVHRAIEVDLRRWRKNPFAAQTRTEWQAFKADLQRERYDAVLDLQGLTKSALVSLLARLAPGGQRFAMANRTSGSSYEAPTRWVADVATALPWHIHVVQRSRLVCARALGYSVTPTFSYGLAGQTGPLQEDVEAGVPIVPPTKRPCVAIVHGSSRADKQWPLERWLALGARLNEQGYTLALPHGSQAEHRVADALATKLEHAIVWPRLDLDAMTDALSTCVGVVGVDSGLSHLAVALDLLHVQIYNFNTAWRTGPQQQGHQASVFAQPAPSVDAVWQTWMGVTGVIPPTAPSGITL